MVFPFELNVISISQNMDAPICFYMHRQKT